MISFLILLIGVAAGTHYDSEVGWVLGPVLVACWWMLCTLAYWWGDL